MDRQTEKTLQTALLWGGGAFVLFHYAGPAIAKFFKSLIPGLEPDGAEAAIINKSATDQAWNPRFWNKPGASILTSANVKRYIGLITGSMGWFSDDFSQVFGVFKQLKTKSQVSYLVDQFAKQRGQDLLTWLIGGYYPNDRLSTEQINQILNYVKRLPDYKV